MSRNGYVSVKKTETSGKNLKIKKKRYMINGTFRVGSIKEENFYVSKKDNSKDS